MKQKTSKKAAVIVAHPDDETLWAGGTIMMGRDYNWQIISLCRGAQVRKGELLPTNEHK